MAIAKYDWSVIRQEYVSHVGPIAKQDLAEKYGMASETLIRKATKEQWDIQRDRFLTRVQEQKTEKKAEVVATKGAQWDATCMSKAEALMVLVDAELKGQITLDREGKQVLLQRAAKDIGAAIKTAQDVGKAALGDKPETTVKIDGKLDLSIEQVIQEYADSDISPISTENGS